MLEDIDLVVPVVAQDDLHQVGVLHPFPKIHRRAVILKVAEPRRPSLPCIVAWHSHGPLLPLLVYAQTLDVMKTDASLF